MNRFAAKDVSEEYDAEKIEAQRVANEQFGWAYQQLKAASARRDSAMHNRNRILAELAEADAKLAEQRENVSDLSDEYRIAERANDKANGQELDDSHYRQPKMI